jgi:uncharacterized metal-binding protein YceD (DUF177 family)
MAANRIEPDVGKAWPNLVGMAEIAREPVSRTLMADDEARPRIAKVVGVDALLSLEAKVRAATWLDGAQINGTWRARVTQTCGVTLEPFDTDLDGEFQIRAVPEGSQALQTTEDHELELDLEADDPPDMLTSDQLDLGAYVVEDLSLAVDPFPRKPGAEFEAPDMGGEISPFAVLAKLKSGKPDA